MAFDIGKYLQSIDNVDLRARLESDYKKGNLEVDPDLQIREVHVDHIVYNHYFGYQPKRPAISVIFEN